MIRHGRTLPIRSEVLHIDHIATLQKFVYRLTADLDDVTRKRLESVIQTYKRLYTHG